MQALLITHCASEWLLQGGSPEAQSIDSKDDELAEAKGDARAVAALLNGFGGLLQLATASAAVWLALSNSELAYRTQHNCGVKAVWNLAGFVKQRAGLQDTTQSC